MILRERPAIHADRHVSSEAELLLAITDALRAYDASARFPSAGRRILIAAPFAVRQPIVIPAEAAGLTIEAIARFPIVAKGHLSALFDIRADMVTLRGVHGRGVDADNDIDVFALVAADSVHIRSCVAYASALCGSTAIVSGLVLEGCEYRQHIAPGSDIIDLHAAHSIIARNVSLLDPLSISLGSSSEKCCITGNALCGGDIDTSTSSGGNSITGNTAVGVKTLHGTDADVGNT